MVPTSTQRTRQRRLRERQFARRRRLAFAAACLAALAFAVGLISAGSRDSSTPSADESRPQLPRGGRDLFPSYRLVAFYGAPQSDELGALGIGTPRQAAERLARQARSYRGQRPVLPVFELLASIASSDPGEDGDYRLRQPDSVIRRYLTEARRLRGLLLLDVQPGRAEFAAEIQRLRPYLRQPDVGLALDPEWHIGPGQVPGQQVGSVTANEVNAISADLAGIVKRHRLPEKLFVIHQFTDEMVRNRPRLRPRRGLATVLNVDGFGDPPNKIAKYRTLHPPAGSQLRAGFKLFYEEDTDLMGPDQVLDLRPSPDLIIYE